MERQDAIEEIALIRRVIEESRRFTFDNGKHYLLWGVLVTIAIFLQYWAILTHADSLSPWIWLFSIGLGWVGSIVFGMREKSKPGAWPVGAKLVAAVWISAGVSMTILGFVGPASGALRYWAVCPTIATVMGGAYVVSSLIYKLKWVTMVGIAWWIGGLLMFMVRGVETLPIFGVMMILFQIVPAVVFNRTWKRLSAPTSAV